MLGMKSAHGPAVGGDAIQACCGQVVSGAKKKHVIFLLMGNPQVAMGFNTKSYSNLGCLKWLSILSHAPILDDQTIVNHIKS